MWTCKRLVPPDQLPTLVATGAHALARVYYSNVFNHRGCSIAFIILVLKSHDIFDKIQEDEYVMKSISQVLQLNKDTKTNTTIQEMQQRVGCVRRPMG